MKRKYFCNFVTIQDRAIFTLWNVFIILSVNEETNDYILLFGK